MSQPIPVINLAPLGTVPGHAATARELVAACHRVGFCYLINHGVDRRVEAAAFDAARAFFALPLTAKTRLSIANSPHFRGYTPLGSELTRGVPDWREQLDLGLDEVTDICGPAEPPWRRLRGPNQWPAELPEMAATIAAWSTAMRKLAVSVLRALAVGLGQSPDRFDDCMLPRGDPHIKLLRYQGVASESSGRGGPGQGASERAAPAGQGVGWHHDSGLLTFILQDDAAGLEVRTDEGVVAATPVPASYLMNLGEMLQRATSGYLRATEHRVVSPPPDRERLSLAYFAHPRFESVFEPVALPDALAAEAPGGANADPADRVHRCFGDNYLKIRLRSHPDVAERFYADVRGRL